MTICVCESEGERAREEVLGSGLRSRCLLSLKPCGIDYGATRAEGKAWILNNKDARGEEKFEGEAGSE